MIKRKTTFVLGAGASVFCGYPTGPQLLEKILSITKEGSSKIEFIRSFTGIQITSLNLEKDYYFLQ